jgi:hypothetical protein
MANISINSPFLFWCEAAKIFAYRESMCFLMDGGDRLALWKHLLWRAYKYLAWSGDKADNTKASISNNNKRAYLHLLPPSLP